MRSITLQTSDNDVNIDEKLGSLSFAASNESSGSDAILIGASIDAIAESTFTSINNATSIVFSTASSDSASPKVKITSGGHFFPVDNNVYDIGATTGIFRNGYFGNLFVNNTPVSVSGHSHVSSDILDFNSAVSGLIPVKDIVSGTDISVTSSSGIYTINSTVASVDEANKLVTTVFNKSGSPIPKMSVVYIDGGQGDQPTIGLAIASGEATSSKTYGITAETINNMSAGKVIVEGSLSGLNTDQWNPTAPTGDINGTVLYLSPTVSGGITNTKPSAPNHMVSVGTVVRTHQNEGIIEVRIQNGFELQELHNVAISGVSGGQFLQYNSNNNLWIPSSSGNFTTLTVNGSGVSLSGHSHTASNITDFNSSVSGLLPTISNSGDNRLLTSTGSTLGINAESNLIFDGSKLGVNTSSPTTALHVNGTLTIDAAGQTFNNYSEGLRISAASNGYSIVTFGANVANPTGVISNQWWVGKHGGTNGFNIFGVPAGDAFHILPGGNIGVGTIAPQTKLHIKGSTTYGSLRISPVWENAESMIGFFQDSAGSDNNDAWVIGQGGWANTGDFVIGNENNGAGGNVRLLIEKAGNVGIGTTAPLHQLSVVGTGNFSQNLLVNGTGVSLSGHSHTSSNITDFNSSVSGLLPVTNIVAGTNITVSNNAGAFTINSTAAGGATISNSGVNRLLVSDGSTSGIVGQANLTFNDSLFSVTGSGNFSNALFVNGTGVSLSGHSHTSSSITDFNSSVSGLLNKSCSFFTATQNQPPASGFATLDTRNSIPVLEFDAATNESAVFMGVLPSNAVVSSGLIADLWWMADTATSGNVVWSVQFESQGTDNDTDSFDVATSGTATANGTNGIETETAITCTAIDSLTAGKRYRLKVNRVATDAADTMTGDAQLIGVEVRIV